METDIQATDNTSPGQEIDQLTAARRLLWNAGVLSARENERMKPRIAKQRKQCSEIHELQE